MLDLVSDSSIKINYENEAPEELLSLIKNELNTDKKYIGYAPGAGGKEKIWDLENFLKVANYFLKKNYMPVFFLGPNERNYQKIIKKILKR
jgi:ADP-heptose:LPS heptosyltransferase